MKVKQISAGVLTNFEVIEFLRSREVSRGSTRLIAPEDKPKLQVYDYLVSSAACNQTRESINEFLKKCEKYDLAKAEKLNIINIRPSSVVEFQPIIEECEKRMTDEIVEELVVNVLPSPPTQPGTEDEDMEENLDGVEKLIKELPPSLPTDWANGSMENGSLSSRGTSLLQHAENESMLLE